MNDKLDVYNVRYGLVSVKIIKISFFERGGEMFKIYVCLNDVLI